MSNEPGDPTFGDYQDMGLSTDRTASSGMSSTPPMQKAGEMAQPPPGN
ncbi:hypothetical protein QFZ67_000142 [Streptomyces sp. V1I1]|nr:hypothetical protein [Streptomyces sp. V1I1]